MPEDGEGFEGFEWDPAKSETTFAERGIDFEFAARVFDGDYIEQVDLRRDYGAQRFVVTGEVDGLVVTLVWTPRRRWRRIISAWPASNRERRAYREHRTSLE